MIPFISEQTKDDLDQFYQKVDPWNYQTNQDDILRKDKIIKILKSYNKRYKRALDIGCGEGWITKDLPADELNGIELSDNAAKRIPEYIKRINQPSGKYDLIIATGVMYPQYEYKTFIEWILKHANGIVLICSVKDVEVDLSELGKSIYQEEFKYREYIEQLKVYEFSRS